MSFYNDIVDRDSEIKSLITAINTNDSFTINILFAPTAIGKSSLTTKLSKRLKDENIECVVVRTNPMNKTALPEWTFVTCLFDELNRLYQNDTCSFNNLYITLLYIPLMSPYYSMAYQCKILKIDSNLWYMLSMFFRSVPSYTYNHLKIFQYSFLTLPS